VIVLVDARFADPFYRDLFPPHWQYGFIQSTSDLQSALDQFWSGQNELF